MSDFLIPPKQVEEDLQTALAVAEERANKEDESAVEAPKTLMNDPDVPEKAKPSEEEITEFWSLMLKKKPFTEDFDIKGLIFSVKSRSGKEVKALMNHLDSLSDKDFMSGPIARANASLASAITSFQNKSWEKYSLEERISLLEDHPSPVNKIMVDAMAQFDLKVAIMMEEISSENF